MPSKLLRVGYTECTLLFIYYLEYKQEINVESFETVKKQMIKWLYTTSGYYDKEIKSNYFDAVQEKDTNIYLKYMETIYEFLKDSDFLNLNIHNHCGDKEDKNKFFSNFNSKKIGYISQEILYDFINKKNILIISPFGDIMKKQIESENCKRIYNNFPDVGRIEFYSGEYTFFNNGPHNNILETAEYISYKIHEGQKKYDNVIISCGAYSNIIAKMLYNNNKNVLTIGGDLQAFFGILNNRTKLYYKNHNIIIPNEKYWIIEIPESYKPLNYDKIEGGCYW